MGLSVPVTHDRGAMRFGGIARVATRLYRMCVSLSGEKDVDAKQHEVDVL